MYLVISVKLDSPPDKTIKQGIDLFVADQSANKREGGKKTKRKYLGEVFGNRHWLVEQATFASARSVSI